jgi:hypothetical protein
MNSFAIKYQYLLEMSLLDPAFDIYQAAVDSSSASPSRGRELGSEKSV